MSERARSAERAATNDARNGETVPRDLGISGRVAVSWAAAGGILSGGFLVAGMTLAGKLSAGGLLLSSAGLFILGAALGFVHGGVLGFFGREERVGKGEALGALARAILYTIPALAVAWALTGWIAMTTVALYVDRPLPLVGAGVGWVAGAATLVVAAVMGWKALRRAFARWPDRLPGTVLVAASFAALLVSFLVARPEIWGTHFRVTEVGAVLLALGATIWVVGPLVTVALRILRRIPGPHPGIAGVGEGRSAVTGIAIGLAAGGVLGLLVLPFHTSLYGVPTVAAGAGTAGAIVLAVAKALVDEVLLRLVLVTGVFWFLLRWRGGKREGNVAAAIIAAAAVQVLLYAPGIAALGFPTWLAAVGYAVVGVLIPGLVFGAIYWARGLTPAVVAHAAAVGVVAFLAL